MIFHLTGEFADSQNGEDLSELAVLIVTNHHYMSVDSSKTLQKIKDTVDAHASTKQKKLWADLFAMFAKKRPTTLQKTYIRQVIPATNDDFNHLCWLATSPGTVILENAHNEWETYIRIAETYKSDRKFGTLFQLLAYACRDNRIKSIHAGGCGDIPAAYHKLLKDEGIVADKLNVKNFIVFDRDSDNETDIKDDKRNLFTLVGINPLDSYTIEDIKDNFSLSQKRMGWHMWYKRAIENYFDDQCFVDIGMGPVNTEGRDRNYVNISHKNTPKYQKNRLPELASHTSRERNFNGVFDFRMNLRSAKSKFLILSMLNHYKKEIERTGNPSSVKFEDLIRFEGSNSENHFITTSGKDKEELANIFARGCEDLFTDRHDNTKLAKFGLTSEMVYDCFHNPKAFKEARWKVFLEMEKELWDDIGS